MDAENSTGKRQQRKACDTCRRRKVRCDVPVRPTDPCSGCRKAGIECRFTAEWAKPRRQRPNSGRPIDTESGIPLDRSTHSSTEHTSSGDILGTANAGLAGLEHGDPSLLTALDSPQQGMDTVASGDANSPEGPAAMLRREHLARSGLADFFNRGIDAGIWAVFETHDSFRIAYIGTGVSNLYHLVDLHQSSRTCLVSSSSAVDAGTAVFDQGRAESASGLASSGPGAADFAPKLLHYPYPPIRPLKPWKPTPNMWFSSSAHDLATEVSSFPAPEVRDALVTAYFQHIHPFLPVISMPEFLATYRSPGKAPPLLLFQALLMAGAHACEHPLVANDRHAVKSILFRRASLLYHSRHESDRIHLMQAAILFTWHIGDGDTVAGGPWYWSGIAVRIGCGLGAHRHSAVLPALETSQYRRCWWSAFVVETMSSLETGRPCAIRADDIDQIALEDEDMTDMPSVPPILSGTPESSGSIPGVDIRLTTSSTSPDFLNHMVELARIGLDILAANAPVTERLVQLNSINARLGRWALHSGMSPATRTDDATRCHLRIHYNLMLLHLYRNFDNMESHTVRSTAAQAIIGSLERLTDLNCLCQCHFTGVSAVTAAGIQLVKEIGAATDAGNFLVAIPALDQLSRQLQCAKLLARYWPNADAVYGVFRDLHQKYEGYAKHGVEGQQVTATEPQPDWNLLLSGAQFSHLDSLSVDQGWLNIPTWSGLM